jgi:hypothetical protein
MRTEEGPDAPVSRARRGAARRDARAGARASVSWLLATSTILRTSLQPTTTRDPSPEMESEVGVPPSSSVEAAVECAAIACAVTVATS